MNAFEKGGEHCRDEFGNRPIAELLLENGAEPTLFSAAMLGQLDVVKAMIAAQPGVQRTRGPHSISLLAHARAVSSPASPQSAARGKQVVTSANHAPTHGDSQNHTAA